MNCAHAALAGNGWGFVPLPREPKTGLPRS